MYGFCENLSTHTAILKLMDNISRDIDQNNTTYAFLLTNQRPLIPLTIIYL